MPISPTYPGVYVQEVPSGVRTITGVSTSIGLFVGFTRSGPVDTPTLCTSLSDYTRVYGDDTTAGDMARQVKLFFLNGGTQCYVVRVAEGAARRQQDGEAEPGADVEQAGGLEGAHAAIQEALAEGVRQAPHRGAAERAEGAEDAPRGRRRGDRCVECVGCVGCVG